VPSWRLRPSARMSQRSWTMRQDDIAVPVIFLEKNITPWTTCQDDLPVGRPARATCQCYFSLGHTTNAIFLFDRKKIRPCMTCQDNVPVFHC